MSDPATPIDPATREVFARFLSYGHPFWMLLTTGLLALALREGLGLRKARLRGDGIGAGARMLHVKVARIAVIALVVGAALGPVSVLYLRGFEVLSSLHAWVALSVASLGVATGVLGWRLFRGNGSSAEVHGWLGLVTVFGTAAAFLTGFVLLP